MPRGKEARQGLLSRGRCAILFGLNANKIISRSFVMSDKIKCARCGEKRPALGYAPIPTELGGRIGAEICQPCWAAWLQKQNQLINHYGLDLSNPDTHEFLFDNMKIFFFNEGVQLAQIDESKEGTVKW